MKYPQINLQSVTLYIGLWGWQILAMLFLVTSMIMFSIPRNIHGFVFGIAFFCAFLICEWRSLKRKDEFYKETEINNS